MTAIPEAEVDLCAPIPHICQYADAYNLPRRLDAINQFRRGSGKPPFLAIGPGASMPLPTRRTHDVASHRREMGR